MAYRLSEVRIGAQPIANVESTQYHPLGTRVKAVDQTYGEGEFVYLKGVASTVVGSVVTYNADDFTSTLLVTGAKGPCAVAMSICDAATKYGWYQIAGKAVVKSATVSDNGVVYASGTAGQVDDAVQAGDLVYGAKFASANGTPSAGLAECEIDHPYTLNAEIVDSTEVTASGAKLNYVDVTLGTGAASKVVSLDASSNFTSPGAGTWAFASGSTVNIAGTFQVGGASVTSSAAELNIVDGVLATADEINSACDESARAVSISTTPISITAAAHAMKTILLNVASGSTITLPAATGSGTRYRFHVATSCSSNAYIIKVAPGASVMDGMIFALDDTGTPVLFAVVTAADSDTITMDGSTRGGIIGDWLELVDLATNQWGVHGFLKLSGTEASPFSATVS